MGGAGWLLAAGGVALAGFGIMQVADDGEDTGPNDD
jgi:hypothetical protein